MAELSILMSNGHRRTLRLGRNELLVGRDESCDLVLDDPTCSRRHFRIHSPRAESYVIEDLGSRNGTLVNGEEASTHELRHGDEIRVGQCSLRYLDKPDDVSARVVLTDEETHPDTISVYRQKPSVSESRLNQLLELTSRLVGTFDQRSVLERAMDICIETLRFERGLIVEVAKRQAPWQIPVVRNLRPGPDGEELHISRSILNRAIERGERSIINNAMGHPGEITESMVQNRICSAMCVPITWQDQILGAVYGDRTTLGEEYTEDDVNFLAGLAAQIGAAIRNSQLVREEKSRQQMENDLKVARQIQEGLIPQGPLLRDDVEVVAFNDPGRSVSGDYYDILPLGDGRVGVVMADVSGKGVPAGMLMSNLQAAVRVLLPGATDLVQIASRLNCLIHDNTDGAKFITALIGIVDPRQRTLHYVNAGHYPPYRITSQGNVQAMPDRAGTPLGVQPDREYPLVETSFGPEEVALFLFTDGIPEALNRDDEFFGLGRIEEFLRRNARSTPMELITRCRRKVDDFIGHAPQSDDVTLMVVRLPAAGAASAPAADG